MISISGTVWPNRLPMGSASPNSLWASDWVTRATGGDGIDGGVWPGPAHMERPFVQLFVEVEDIDAAVTDATKLGASVIVPKSVVPDGDAMAVLLDPNGMAFAVCTRTY